MKYHFKLHREKKGYWAECIELKGCVTQAQTKKELLVNIQEALNLYLDEPESSKVLFEEPDSEAAGEDVVAVAVDPKVAFAMVLRQERVKYRLTQMQVAKKLGLKNAYSYQRLENSKTANPSLLTIVLLKSIFPRLNLEAVLA